MSTTDRQIAYRSRRRSTLDRASLILPRHEADGDGEPLSDGLPAPDGLAEPDGLAASEADGEAAADGDVETDGAGADGDALGAGLEDGLHATVSASAHTVNAANSSLLILSLMASTPFVGCLRRSGRGLA